MRVESDPDDDEEAAMDRPHQQDGPVQDGPVQDLNTALRDEPLAVSPTDTLLAAVKAGPPPERAWLVEEIARRDRQTAEALRDALEERAGSRWLRDTIEERSDSTGAEG